MLDLGKDTSPLSDFNRRTPEVLRRLKSTRRALLLTLNGKPEVIVQDVHAYQALLERVAELEAAATTKRPKTRDRAMRLKPLLDQAYAISWNRDQSK